MDREQADSLRVEAEEPLRLQPVAAQGSYYMMLTIYQKHTKESTPTFFENLRGTVTTDTYPDSGRA
jgi:hypothetical protein